MAKDKLTHCLNCGNELGKRQMMFCSNHCKLTHPDTIKTRNKPKPVNDKTKALKSNIDDKIIYDINNNSGACIRHLQKNGISDTEWSKYFTIIDSPKHNKEKYKCKYCNWTTVDIVNKSGWITTHMKKEHDIEATEHIEKYPEDAHFWTHLHSPELREHILSKDEDGYVICEECGIKFKSIMNVHLSKHGLTVEQYKEKYPNASITSKKTSKKLQELYHEKADKINAISNRSKAEIQIEEFLKSVGINVRHSYRKLLGNLEVDLFLPDHNIAIEYNGLYYHSEYAAGKLSDYHLNKTTRCEEQGVRVIHIFEDEWKEKSDIVKSRLLNIIGVNKNIIYARDTTIKEISRTEKNEFLNKYHIQGTDKSRIFIGLYHEDRLISVMTFSNFRVALGGKNTNKDEYELTRMASSHVVTGGASKMFKYFLDTYNPLRIIAFADRRWSSNIFQTVYEKMGFTKLKPTKPNYTYTKNYHNRLHKFAFTRKNIMEKFGGDPTLTIQENMFNLGYDRVWDCGHMKFEYINDKYAKVAEQS